MEHFSRGEFRHHRAQGHSTPSGSHQWPISARAKFRHHRAEGHLTPSGSQQWGNRNRQSRRGRTNGPFPGGGGIPASPRPRAFDPIGVTPIRKPQPPPTPTTPAESHQWTISGGGIPATPRPRAFDPIGVTPIRKPQPPPTPTTPAGSHQLGSHRRRSHDPSGVAPMEHFSRGGMSGITAGHSTPSGSKPIQFFQLA